MIVITTTVIAVLFVVGIGVTAMVSKNRSEKISENFGWNEKDWACQEFCVNEIKTFEKSIENDVDLCRFSCLCIPPGSPQEIQLASDDPPVGIGHHPLRSDVQRPQVEHLHHRRGVREGGLPVGHFPQGRVEALNRVGRVDHFPDLGRVRIQPFRFLRQHRAKQGA